LYGGRPARRLAGQQGGHLGRGHRLVAEHLVEVLEQIPRRLHRSGRGGAGTGQPLAAPLDGVQGPLDQRRDLVVALVDPQEVPLQELASGAGEALYRRPAVGAGDEFGGPVPGPVGALAEQPVRLLDALEP
jgi:hypothetical protein